MIEKFTQLESRAAWIDEDNVDTDAIFPARFLLLLERETLGRYAFHDRRYDSDGHPRDDFILNRPEYRSASILITGRNFGCGSSREHAVWTLLGQGIRCVIAVSFGEIFRANCIKNGLLPIALDEDEVAQLMRDAQEQRSITVDLVAQMVSSASRTFPVAIEAEDRDAMLSGRDEVATIIKRHGADIRGFEAAHKQTQPWLFDVDIVRRSQPSQ